VQRQAPLLLLLLLLLLVLRVVLAESGCGW
jgi:hypothetical protein